jgi:hypothetical protein
LNQDVISKPTFSQKQRFISNPNSSSINKDESNGVLISKKEQNSITLSALPLSSLTQKNWPIILNTLKMTGNGLHVLSHSNARYLNKTLYIEYLSKTESIITPKLKASIIIALKIYFKEKELSVILVSKPHLEATPYTLKKEEDKVKKAHFFNQLENNECIKILQRELNAVFDHTTIMLA